MIGQVRIWIACQECVAYDVSTHFFVVYQFFGQRPIMIPLYAHPSGRHFLQIPGPTHVPERVLRAIHHATIDHRGPEFGQLGLALLQGMQWVFQTRSPLSIYPSPGTGAGEAALVTTLPPGDRVLMAVTWQFGSMWDLLAL